MKKAIVLLIVLSFYPAAARADVLLGWTPDGGDLTITLASFQTSITVRSYLSVTEEESVEGFSFFLSSSSFAGNSMTLDSAASALVVPYSIVFAPDTPDENIVPANINATGDNGQPLGGALTTTQIGFLPSLPYRDFTFTFNGFDIWEINLVPDSPLNGWVDGSVDPVENRPWTSTGTLTIVIPEPNALLMLTLGGFAVLRRRRGV